MTKISHWFDETFPISDDSVASSERNEWFKQENGDSRSSSDVRSSLSNWKENRSTIFLFSELASHPWWLLQVAEQRQHLIKQREFETVRNEINSLFLFFSFRIQTVRRFSARPIDELFASNSFGFVQIDLWFRISTTKTNKNSENFISFVWSSSRKSFFFIQNFERSREFENLLHVRVSIRSMKKNRRFNRVFRFHRPWPCVENSPW